MALVETPQAELEPRISRAEPALGRLAAGAEQEPKPLLAVEYRTRTRDGYEVHNEKFSVIGSDRLSTTPKDSIFILTQNPELSLSLIEGGPLELDKREPFTLVEIGDVSRNVATQEQTTSLLKSELRPDGIFVINAEQGILLVPKGRGDKDYITDANLWGHVDNLPHVVHALEARSEDFAFPRTTAYKSIPEVRQAYAKLGMSFDVNRQATWPIPKEFRRRLELLRHDPENRLYIPDIELLPTGSIKKEPYVHAYRRGVHPIGAASFDLYAHDIASEHLLSLMVYGEPLVDLLAHFAEAVEEEHEINFGDAGFLSGDRIATGDEKLELATGVIDDTTNELALVDINIDDVKILDEARNSKDETKKVAKPVALLGVFEVLTKAVKQHGKFEEMALAKAIIENDGIKPEDITGEMILDELIAQTRERFNIRRAA